MKHLTTRRSFLKAATGGGLAFPWIRRSPPAAPRADFDPDFDSASRALQALRSGLISSRELTEYLYRRIQRYNPALNAFITLDEEGARQRALQADDARARGQEWGPLHGLPVLVKDTFETAGLRTTAGSKTLEKYVPSRDAEAVARLKGAGAIILGKTSLPEFAADLQTYNELIGTTRNPWNPERTPGGSTGGGAAALAAGLGFLELGSDIGGSIRTPCHFCGIYGLKPSLGVVPLEGHVPPPPGTIQPPPDLGVAGPMARSPQDLRLALEVLGGPSPQERAWRWELAAGRGARLGDYRLGYVLDDPFCPVPPEVQTPLTETIDALARAGARLEPGWPPGIQLQEMFEIYLPLLAAAFSQAVSPEEREAMQKAQDRPGGASARLWLKGSAFSHSEWRAYTVRRLEARRLWQEYFRTHDAFLLPVNFVPAFPHNQEGRFFERTVGTSQGLRGYGEMLCWISVGTLTGCPALSAPVGRTADGLPVGIQILGPYLEDATAIDLAGRLADVVGGFEPPPGSSASG